MVTLTSSFYATIWPKKIAKSKHFCQHNHINVELKFNTSIKLLHTYNSSELKHNIIALFFIFMHYVCAFFHWQSDAPFGTLVFQVLLQSQRRKHFKIQRCQRHIYKMVNGSISLTMQTHSFPIVSFPFRFLF